MYGDYLPFQVNRGAQSLSGQNERFLGKLHGFYAIVKPWLNFKQVRWGRRGAVTPPRPKSDRDGNTLKVQSLWAI